MLYKKIESIVKRVVGSPCPIDIIVMAPERPEFGHFTTNTAMLLAKYRGENPRDVAEELVADIKERAPKNFFESVDVAGQGFINFKVTKETMRDVLLMIAKKGSKYGKLNTGRRRKVIVEYSQPNIAKPLHAGHLRNTILGDAIANVHEHVNYRVIRWNYLGDWGTQFGVVIAAYKKYGDREEIKKDPINEILKLYTRFNAEAKEDPSLFEEARMEFKKLEDGNEENLKLWKWFRDESIKEIKEVYKLLGVKFTNYIGEAFFEDKMTSLVEELKRKGMAKKSEGAVIIPLDEYKLPPALIQKSDGSSLYVTRDIAALRYRLGKYKPSRMLYVVGAEQELAFRQLFAIANMLGLDKRSELAHISYGLVLGEDGKRMSTRAGKGVGLREMTERSISQARKMVSEKNPNLSDKEKDEIAKVVGIGALKYFNLKDNKTSSIKFDWDKILSLTGDSGPYLQYTYVRLASVLDKAKDDNIKISTWKRKTAPPESDDEDVLVRKLLDFPEELKRSVEQISVSNLALYLHELAVLANRFYEKCPILKEEDDKKKNTRLLIARATADVLENGMGLLGMRVLLRM